ncbi:MAG TPA: hypothetical protein VMW48_14920 [Vicinamibacterales bacterium]|nr:hypothetical protein [Vicinamibacterales bacterium]
MFGFRSRFSVAVTLLVGAATLFALALPEGIGGRDSVIRLTRGGLQRIGCPDTASYGRDDAESCLDTPADPLQPAGARCDGPTVVAVVAAAVFVPVPAATLAPARSASPARPAVPPGHAAAGRAPPAL